MAYVDDTNTRCAADAAAKFVSWYYNQINEAKGISQSYVTNNETYKNAGHPPADICVNGLVCATPEDWEKLLAQQRDAPKAATDKKHVRYLVDTYDTHVINADYRFGATQNLIDLHGVNDGVRMMIMINVSGTVYFGVSMGNYDEYAVKQHFNDVFILVPNWDTLGKGSKYGKKFLIASQTYRAY
ncbi:hypothetical protein B0T21DRAFT_346936 [Apiosordaria backusii]|uniref:NTF2 domain-containing protein n=1 Tax=Apiosordaria backusii TaxID=314023 RepID=A0AA40EHU5_9PEZI|nr:hypothetical protein B0T21DRAFT_346936 [Apiosordaria backusii]